MALVNFKRGLKANLPTAGQDGVLYITTDTHEIYKGFTDGVPPIKLSDVLFVDTLPSEGVSGKLYVTMVEEDLTINTWLNSQWYGFSGGMDENTLNEVLGYVNKTETLSYDLDGNIIGVAITGDVTKDITYGYDTEGNITSETIVDGNKRVISTFGYSSDGNIETISTIVEDIV